MRNTSPDPRFTPDLKAFEVDRTQFASSLDKTDMPDVDDADAGGETAPPFDAAGFAGTSASEAAQSSDIAPQPSPVGAQGEERLPE